MKINLYQKIAFIGIFTVFLVTNGCDDSILDDPKPQEFNENDYYKNESEMKEAILGVYAAVHGYHFWNGEVAANPLVHPPLFPILLMPDDMATSNASASHPAAAFEAFGPLESSNSILKGWYGVSYDIIQRANTFLEKNKEADEDVYSENPELKDNNRGEALFLRSYAFFNLWNFFGTAPVVTERIKTTDEAYPGPSSGTDLLDQAITDLKEAAELLPNSWNEENVGRVTKNSAYGMLGKILLFRGTVNNTQEDFTAAVNNFNKIKGASLVADWTDNFAFDTENNAESLFEFQAGAGSNPWLFNAFDNAVGDVTTAQYTGFINTNNYAYGGSRVIATEKAINALDPADPRTSATVVDSNRFVIKFSQRGGPLQNGLTSRDNPRIMRYAEVLLLKAEAVLRSGGSTSEAIGYINEVRTRARNFGGGTEPANRPTTETDKDVVMKWIMNEKMIELAYEESHRWWDLRRWAMSTSEGYYDYGIQLNNNFFSSDNANFDFNYPGNLMFPIPLDELDRNPNMEQNDFYN